MRRLLVRYGLAMTSIVLIAFLVPLGLLARSLAEERALTAARQDAATVAVFAGGGEAERARLEAALLAVNDGPRATTVFLPDGAVFLPDGSVVPPDGSAFPPDGEFPPGGPVSGTAAPRTDAVELAGLGRAVTARTVGGIEVVLPVAGPAGTAVVRTFVPDAQLTEGVLRSWAALAGVGAALLALTALVGRQLAARLSRSVLDLATVAERLGAGDLGARVEPAGPPEVASVGRVLNRLGAQVEDLLAAERELVADLSHRLRTPVTALRLDADLLADPDERQRLVADVDRLVASVDAIVRSAREPDGRAGGCDTAAVVGDRARFWGVLATAQGRVLQVDLPPDARPVAVSAAELGAALDALVDNVFGHTPEGTGFALAVRDVAAGGGVGLVEIVVADDGPGLASTGLRARGASGAGSTGLGLDVARRAAEAAGGRLRLEASPGGGASIVMELPTA